MPFLGDSLGLSKQNQVIPLVELVFPKAQHSPGCSQAVSFTVTFTNGVLLMHWHVGQEDGESLVTPSSVAPHSHISWLNFSLKSRRG